MKNKVKGLIFGVPTKFCRSIEAEINGRADKAQPNQLLAAIFLAKNIQTHSVPSGYLGYQALGWEIRANLIVGNH